MTLLLKIRQAVCRIAFLTAVCIPLRAQQLPPLQPSQDTRQFLQEFLQQLMNTAQEPQVQASGTDLAPQDILAVSLAFSGCLPGTPEADDVMGRYNELAAIVTSPEYAALPEPQRAERILTLIYEQVLKQYQADQTSIPVMFSKGTYNCVSSTVLYMSLARAAGLDVRAQRTPDHAFCTLYTSGGADVRPVDIETTNPRGFDPGKRRQIASNRYYIVPKKSYAGRHQISARMLAGLTARNLSILYMNANDYEHAVPLAAARMIFMQPGSGAVPSDTDGGFPLPASMPADSADDSRKDFDSICINYGAMLQKASRFEQAVQWFTAAAAQWGITAALQDGYDSSVFNCIAHLCNSGNAEQASSFYAQHAARLSASYRQELDGVIFLAVIEKQLSAMNAAQAVQFLLQVRQNTAEPAMQDAKTRAQVDGWLEYHWINRITEISNEQGYMAADKEITAAMQQLPRSRNLQNVRQQNLYNHDVEVHNAFADLANARRYDEARQVLDKGLQENPGSRTLQNDSRTLSRLLKNQ